jgi:hypothetical protein
VLSDGSVTVMAAVEGVIALYRSGFLGGDEMPEDALLPVVPASRLPDVLTLGMSLNFQRNSYSLWRAVASCYADPDDRWVLSTESVALSNPETVREVLVRTKIALQPTKHIDIWMRVAAAIKESGGTLEMVRASQSSVGQLAASVQGDRKKQFPYLSGPKIFNYWVYVLEQYCGIEWSDRQLITVAPDTHILQASVRLGLVPESVLDGSESSRGVVAAAWRDLLRNSGLVPIDVHTPLWLWSRAGFPQTTTAQFEALRFDNSVT